MEVPPHFTPSKTHGPTPPRAFEPFQTPSHTRLSPTPPLPPSHASNPLSVSARENEKKEKEEQGRKGRGRESGPRAEEEEREGGQSERGPAGKRECEAEECGERGRVRGDRAPSPPSPFSAPRVILLCPAGCSALRSDTLAEEPLKTWQGRVVRCTRRGLSRAEDVDFEISR